MIGYETENSLWDRGILEEDTPDKLRNTVLFLLGINVHLTVIEEHYYLQRLTPVEASQLSFERNEKGVKCLVYREDSITKTHDGGLADMHRDRKIVWVYPSEKEVRCPMILVEKYVGLCPLFMKRTNFYLQFLQRPGPKKWYSNQVVG